MLPAKLYKYRPLDGDSFRYTQSIFTRNELFFSKLSRFNDPFEGHFNARLPYVKKKFDAIEYIQASISTNSVVLSLAESNDNILMWSHYADLHRGICIEFDTSIPGTIFSKAKKVLYVNKFNDFVLKSDKEREVATHISSFTKSKLWKYEDEWRILEQEEGCYSFPAECITGVILGCRISEDHKRWVKDWVNGRATPTKIYLAKQCPDAFSLNIV